MISVPYGWTGGTWHQLVETAPAGDTPFLRPTSAARAVRDARH